MTREDLKIERWSARRGLDRTAMPMSFRFSPEERHAIEVEAASRLVRPSDVVRGCLIYAGVTEPPAADREEDRPADGETTPEQKNVNEL